jgi:hypothetical protein
LDRGLRQPLALADVPRHVGPSRRDVVGQLRLRHAPVDLLDQPREPLLSIRPLQGGAAVHDRHACPVPHDRHRTVLGDTPVDGPLARQHRSPAARAPRDGDELQPCVVEVPECAIGLARQSPVGEERVVEVEEDAAQVTRLLRRKVRDRAHQGALASMRAMTALR